MNPDDIKGNVLKLQQANATPEDIESYVKSATQEGGTSGITTNGQPVSSNIAGNTLKSLGNFALKVFPNENLGKIIGTPLGAIYAGMTGGMDALKQYDFNPHASATGVAADLGGDAINAASLLAAPETGGASLAARSALSGAAGGGLNLLGSLSNGKSIGDKEVWKDAGGSALISALFPALAEGASGLIGNAKAASGITPQVEKVLKDATPEEVNQYIQAAKAHNVNLNSPTPTGMASDKVDEAAGLIKQNLKTAGQAIGDAIRTDGTKVIGNHPDIGTPHVDEILSAFNKNIEDTFGHEVSLRPADNTKLKIGGDTMSFDQNEQPSLLPLGGRARTIDAPDQKRILNIHDQISKLADDPTVRRAADVVHNLDDLIDYNKIDQFGVNRDPLEGIITKMRGQINAAIRDSSKAVADANDRYSFLKNIERNIGSLAGKDLQRGSLLLRRVFSGDKSGESLKLLNDLKNETGVDLIKHAGLAKFATDQFGNDSSKTLLQQMINPDTGAVQKVGRFLTSPVRAAESLLVPSAQKSAARLSGGAPFVNKLDEFINSPAGQNFLRTYFINSSAAHPEPGKSVGSMTRNLVNNTTGLGI